MRKISRILARFVSSISDEIKWRTVLQKLLNGQEVDRYFPDVAQKKIVKEVWLKGLESGLKSSYRG